jgi:hypothetical protein
MAAYLEATELAGISLDEAARFFGRPAFTKDQRAPMRLLKPLAADDAEAAYLKKFKELA